MDCYVVIPTLTLMYASERFEGAADAADQNDGDHQDSCRLEKEGQRDEMVMRV